MAETGAKRSVSLYRGYYAKSVSRTWRYAGQKAARCLAHNKTTSSASLQTAKTKLTSQPRPTHNAHRPLGDWPTTPARRLAGPTLYCTAAPPRSTGPVTSATRRIQVRAPTEAPQSLLPAVQPGHRLAPHRLGAFPIPPQTCHAIPFDRSLTPRVKTINSRPSELTANMSSNSRNYDFLVRRPPPHPGHRPPAISLRGTPRCPTPDVTLTPDLSRSNSSS